MKNRMMTFLIMLLTVVVLGTGATMLNLSLREKESAEQISFVHHESMGSPVPTAASSPAGDPLDTFETEGQIEGEQTAFIEVGAAETQRNTTGTDNQTECVQEDMPVVNEPSDADKKAEAYYYRLQDMEKIQASLMRSAGKESLSEMQNAMDTALQFWDDELNSIYQKLRHSLPEEAFYKLRDEERAWIRHRDEAANMAAARETYSNSTQNLAYTRSLLEWTKERVYELADMYYGK